MNKELTKEQERLFHKALRSSVKITGRYNPIAVEALVVAAQCALEHLNYSGRRDDIQDMLKNALVGLGMKLPPLR